MSKRWLKIAALTVAAAALSACVVVPTRPAYVYGPRYVAPSPAVVVVRPAPDYRYYPTPRYWYGS